MQLVILASGRGKRLNKITQRKPKCLIKVNGIPLICYFKKTFSLFKKKIIVVGYRSKQIRKFFEKDKSCRFIENSFYNKTSMVHSLYCAKKLINESLLISYADIIFDHKIAKNLIKTEKSAIVVNKNWLKLWKKRMSYKLILKDAESLEIKKNYLVSIGNKIKKIPKYQYMGLIKVSLRDFKIMMRFYENIKNTKIDFTQFIDLLVKNKKIKFKILKTSAFWTEIDSLNDLKITEKLIRETKNKFL